MIVTTKIENLCDQNRQSISNPFLDEDGNLMATNGKAIAIIPKMNNADDTRDNERPFLVTTKGNGFGVMMPAKINR